MRKSPNAPLVVKVYFIPHTQRKNHKEITHYDQALAIHAQLPILSQQMQSPFQFIRKGQASFRTLETLTKAPTL